MALKIKSLRKLVPFKREAMIQLRNTSVNHFKRNFRKEGYYKGMVFIPWKKKKKQNGKKTLISTGALRRSILVPKVSKRSVTFTSNLPYSSVHNDGYKGTQKVRGYTRNVKTKTKSGRKGRPRTETVEPFTRNQNIPKRTYMNVNKKLEKELISKLRKSLKNFL